MTFGFQTGEPRLSEPYALSIGVCLTAGSGSGAVHIEMSPDEARLYALKLLKAADKAEDE